MTQSAYLAWDEDALAALANRGLVRRAGKLLAADAVSAVSAVQQGRGADAPGQITVRVNDAYVTLDGGGPVGARCPCPDPGTCVHIVAAALYLRARAQAAGLTPDRPSLMEAPQGSAAAPQPSARPLTAAQRRVAVDALHAVGELVGQGLSHAASGWVDRVTGLSAAARATGLWGLHRDLEAAAGRMRALVAGEDATDESDVALALARVTLTGQALLSHTEGPAPSLIGSARRRFEPAPTLQVVPLGARWWRRASGARGVTVHLLDRDSGRPLTVTAARPAGTDPSFEPFPDAALVWGTPMSRLMSGPLRLTGPRLDPDGSLSATHNTSVTVIGPHDIHELDAVAVTRWSRIGDRIAGRTAGHPMPAVLLKPHRMMPPELDEAAQELVWPVADAEGRIIDLRRRVAAGHRAAAAHLVDLLRQAQPTHVLAHPEPMGRGPGLVPSTLFLPGDAPTAELLDFTHRRWWQPSDSGTQDRAGQLLAALPGHRAGSSGSGPADLLERISELLSEFYCTGRAVAGARQQRVLRRCRRELTALGLTTIDSTLDAAFTPDGRWLPEQVLVAAWVVHTARETLAWEGLPGD